MDEMIQFIYHFLSVGKRAPAVVSVLPSSTFPTLAEISSYSVALQLNFLEKLRTRLC